jgi:tetratricopeptide (TPR) repeat protein
MRIFRQSLIIISILTFLLLCPSCRYIHPGRGKVKIREGPVTIPTYLTEAPEINPIFYTPANYQGAQRHVYPYPNIDKLTDEKVDKTYTGIFLENEYIRLCILPEIGGRLYIAQDKTNGYNFIYHNQVIKPALIGMAGAWISGGIEWNIPHHHRVSTFMPVDYTLIKNPDGSKTIWVGEYEKRHQTKWEVGLTLYPGKAYVQTDIRFFNVTPVVKSFLIWANPAVHANENYQVIFPPDVEKAVFHSKVEFTDWPVSKQFYRGIDFTEGVDVSWWKNTKSPTSFFAWGTEKDFLGGIDHGKNAGVILIGEHHIFPGKKMWNWGNNEVARLWDQMLTDQDGPYMELMMGSYSDNQPDYSWNNPYSAKYGTFYVYPIKGLNGIKEADKDLAVNLDLKGDTAFIQLYATSSYKKLKILLMNREQVILETTANISPENPFIIKKTTNLQVNPADLELAVLDSRDKELIRYVPPVKKNQPHPPVYKTPPEPELINDVEELYLAGLRLDQFGNPDLDPFKYWEEALKRDSDNINVNTQMGIKMLEKYNYTAAEKYLRKVTDKVTANYTSPKDGEALYYLGLALIRQERYREAYDMLFKATWNYEWTSPAYYLLAVMDSRNGEFEKAYEHLQRSIDANAYNLEAQQLKTIILRHLGKYDEASVQSEKLLQTDALNFVAIFENCRMTNKSHDAKNSILRILRDEPDNYLETASRYANAGLYEEALDLLSMAAGSEESKLNSHPMIWYYLGYYYRLAGNDQKSGEYYHNAEGYQQEAEEYLQKAEECFQKASDLPVNYCFPYGTESEKVLQDAIRQFPDEANGYYYLGNLYCDFQPQKALELWKKAINCNNRTAIYYRNAAFVEANQLDEPDSAIIHLKKAIELNPEDPLYFEELDRYLAYIHTSPEERLKILQDHRLTLESSDGAMARYISLLNLNGKYNQALEILSTRHFHAAEASDINLHVQWADAYILRGMELLGTKKPNNAFINPVPGDSIQVFIPGNRAPDDRDISLAIENFTRAMDFPVNLESARDGKIAVALYLRGLAKQQSGDTSGARQDYVKLINFESIMGWGTGNWPEVNYCKALALQKLGRKHEARDIFNNLIRQGKELAVYQPHSATDLSSVKQRYEIIQTQAEGYYSLALGYFGLGNKETAEHFINRTLKMNPADIGALKYFGGFQGVSYKP